MIKRLLARRLSMQFPSIYDEQVLFRLLDKLPDRTYSISELTFLYYQYKRDYSAANK